MEQVATRKMEVNEDGQLVRFSYHPADVEQFEDVEVTLDPSALPARLPLARLSLAMEGPVREGCNRNARFCEAQIAVGRIGASGAFSAQIRCQGYLCPLLAGQELD